MPAPDDHPPALVLVLVRDLMFLGRINSTARAVRVPVKVIRDPAKLADEAGRRLIADLNLDGAIEAAGAWKGSTGGEVIGFVSHTDAATIAGARAAGVERVLARSRFVETLPDLLRGAPPSIRAPGIATMGVPTRGTPAGPAASESQGDANMTTLTRDRRSVADLLGPDADSLLNYTAKGFPKSALHLPGPDFVDRVVAQSDRTPAVLRNFQLMLNTGRLAGTGYVSILPVDQGIEHSAGASFAPNPIYFDPENIVKLALDGGCNAVASTLGVLGAVARKYAHKIPFLVKLNHNELLTYPNKFDQIMFASVEQAFDMGAVAVGATIYFGSDESTRQIQEVSEAFAHAHELGLVTVLWCYLRNNAFKVKGADGKATDYHTAADLTGQANHLGVTIEADIIKQKLATNNGGFAALNMGSSGYGKFDKRIYTDLTGSDETGKGGHPIDLCRYQLANCYNGRAPLINSGGESKGESDLQDAVRTAVINKRAGGMGLISGRKAFQRPINEGVRMLQTIQDVYLDESVTIA